MKSSIFADHEAVYIVESTARTVRESYRGMRVEMDARGWPLQVSCDYSENPLAQPSYRMENIGMTYKVEDPENRLSVLDTPF